MKKVMAVYDEDPIYAERLSDYVNRKEKGIFQAQAFTSKEKLEAFSKEHKIDLLLTGETAGTGETDRVLSGQRIYLSEDKSAGTTDEARREIYKYQSGDDIIREVMACYCEVPGALEAFPRLKNAAKRMIGVYSPVGRCGKTSFSLSMGQILAREEKVLFVTLDTFTGFCQLVDERWKRDLSDLIYYYKRGRFNAIRLNSVVYFLGNMAWLPPIRFPDDYNQISPEEMALLFNTILDESDYETLLLDVGDYGKRVLPLLEICQCIYMPVKEDPVSQAKVKEFEEYVDDCGKRPLKARIRKLHVPLTAGNRSAGRFPEELMWGDLGDFTRGIIKGNNHIWES